MSTRFQNQIKYPKYRDELVKLFSDDQEAAIQNFHVYNEIKSVAVRNRKFTDLYRQCHLRAHRMLEILDIIDEPTIENIGYEGSEALLYLAQHSYLDIMKLVLNKFENQYKKDPSTVFSKGIPSLTDRINILEKKKQVFGTQWTVDSKKTPFLIAVEDFENVNKRRAKYGLEPIKRPVNLAKGAIKYPIGKGLAKASDQKELNNEEYKAYSQYYLKSLIKS